MNQTHLRKLNLDSLHLEAIKAAENCKKSEAYLLQVLEIVDERALHLECEVTSLYQYCTTLLGLSEGVAYSLIAVIHKGREVPELKVAVLDGKVSLSKAKKICSVINPTNHKEWIELAQHETSRVIEKCVAIANPKEVVKESIQYKSQDRLELKLGVSEEWIELLAEVKDLLSQKRSSAVGSEDALLTVMKEFRNKHCPVKKAERAMAREKKRISKTAPTEQFPGTVGPKRAKRKPLKRFTLHSISLRDQNQCTHISMHGRCVQKRWLEHHHIVPISRGGPNVIANLTTLCHTHHKLQHLRLERSESLKKSGQ